jgi:DNA-binding NtrC family response regulator
MAALSRELAESELFGHEKGAFTGADRVREGVCEHANQGTLFLDEIGEMDIHLQPKLLRFLEERYIQRVGSTKPIPVDVRFVAATNRDPLEHIRRGLLREDLYYRLRGIEIRLPPLRERREDIPVLARHFLAEAVRKNHLAYRTFTPEAIAVLSRFDWPGNVRELLRVTEQLAILSPGDIIDVDDIWMQFGGARSSTALPGIQSKEVQERAMIVKALSITQGNVKEAAAQLGIGYATIYRKIKKYAIANSEWLASESSNGASIH